MWPRLRTTSDLHLGLGTSYLFFSTPRSVEFKFNHSWLFSAPLPIVPMPEPDRPPRTCMLLYPSRKGNIIKPFLLFAYSQMCLIYMITYLTSCVREELWMYTDCHLHHNRHRLQLSTQFYILKTNQHKENGHKYQSFQTSLHTSIRHRKPGLLTNPSCISPNPRSPYRSTCFRCKPSLLLSRVVTGTDARAYSCGRVMKPNGPQRCRHWMVTLMVWVIGFLMM